MIEPVKSGVPPVNPSTPVKAAVPQAAVPRADMAAKAEKTREDTVQLSDESQARSLRQNGLSIPEIALQLRLDIKTVTGFFPESKP